MAFPDPTAVLIETVPSRTPFGLDQIRYSWKTALSAEDAVAACDDPGSAHPDFPKMFLMPITTPEAAETATRVDLVYMGCLRTDEGGNPVLPAQQQKYGNPIQTATSGLPLAGLAPSSPLTLEFYAQTSILSFWSFGATGALGTAPAPVNDPIIRSLTVNDSSYAPGNTSIDQIIFNFFQLNSTDTIEPQEIVPGQYWQNNEVVTLFYGPIVFVTATDGNHVIALFNPGRDYTAADTVSFTGGSVTVNSVNARGGITSISLLSATFSNTTFVISDGSGGTGTGSKFVTIYIP